MNPLTTVPDRSLRPSGTIRLGIVGCGAITESAHLPAALASVFVQVTALVDTSETRMQYLQRQFGLDAILAKDFREILDRVDAVLLALPNAAHAPVGIECLSKGVHVLCEKPLAVSAAECEQLCQAARKSSSVLAVGLVTRFFPSTQLTRQLIESGFLGELHRFDYEFGTAGGWATVSGYNLARSGAGGGVLVVSGSHFIDRMLYIFGDMELVRHVEDTRGGVEANCISWFRGQVHGRPVDGRVALSKTHRLSNRLQIAGEKGMLEIREGQTASVTFLPAQTELRHEISASTAKNRNAEPDYFQSQIEDFARAIQTGGRPAVSGEQGSQSVALMERCYRNAERLDEPWCEATLDLLRAALPCAEISSLPSDISSRGKL
jgi:predicted dehydrogenase